MHNYGQASTLALINSICDFRDDIFENNTATGENGGAVRSSSTAIFNLCDFYYNNAINGGAFMGSNKANFSNCNFEGNTAIVTDSSSLNFESGDVSIIGSTFAWSGAYSHIH